MIKDYVPSAGFIIASWSNVDKAPATPNKYHISEKNI